MCEVLENIVFQKLFHFIDAIELLKYVCGIQYENIQFYFVIYKVCDLLWMRLNAFTRLDTI